MTVTPVYMEITDYIMNKIHTGEWPVGSMIPTEMQLCEQFGVSRPTVRSAVMKLVQEGHLRRIKGKGTFVTAPRVLEQSTVFIESFFQEMYQQGLDVSTEVLEFRLMPGDLAMREKLETENDQLIKLKRLRYVKNSFDQGPIVLTTSWFPADDTFLFRYNYETIPLTKVLNENGKRRKYVEKELTAVPLNAKNSRLLGMEEGELAMCITSVSRDANGLPVDYSESLYPLSRNRFILKLQL